MLQTITMEVAAASDLASALEVVLREVCEKTGWVLGQAWVPNPDATVLDLVAGWYCGDGELKPFKAASEESHFKPGVGLPGRVWKSKQPAWVEDVTNDPNFPRSAAARSARFENGRGNSHFIARQSHRCSRVFHAGIAEQSERLVKVITGRRRAIGSDDGAKTGRGRTLRYERNPAVHSVEHGRRRHCR